MWVRGIDIKHPEFSPNSADEFQELDLRDRDACEQAVAVSGGFDDVYHLAADMGGMSFIDSAECGIMRNNALINLNMVDAELPRRRASVLLLLLRVTSTATWSLVSRRCTRTRLTRRSPITKTAGRSSTPSAPQTHTGRYGFEVRIARFQNC